MNTQRTNLLNFLRATYPFSTSTPLVAKFTGWMVSGIRDYVDLWQEVRDAYGMGADDLMDVLVDYAPLAASCYERLEGDPRFSTIVDERERNVETQFLWVIEDFGHALAELVRDSGSTFDILDGNNLLFERITNWLIPEPPETTQNDPIYLLRCALADLQGAQQAKDDGDYYGHDWKAHAQTIAEIKEFLEANHVPA